MTKKYDIVSLENRYDLFEQQDKICDEVWPEFMRHDPIANTYWMKFVKGFKDYQLMIMDDARILAVMNLVPLHFDKRVKELPDEGWDWGIMKSISDLESGRKPNFLLGLQIVVNIKNQGKGLSSVAVKEMCNLAKKKGFHKLIIPVRPSDKHKYPLIPMEDYIKWENGNGLPFDSWLRVHIKAGGKILKICPKSMHVTGTLNEWEKWTNLNFPESGFYIIPHALNPISVNKEKNIGTYLEPNVWVLHDI